jgi:56kDa selenium binding protein (SBP56)
MHTHDKPASFHSSPQEAMQAPAEEFLYLACLHEGTGVEKPDFLAVVDAEKGEIVHELPMPNVGDELHHFGWNRCSSACHGPDRSHLIVPGFRSSRFHFVNVKDDPRKPYIEKVVEPEEVVAKTGYTRPHTVHCMPGDNIVVSMLGDADGNGPAGSPSSTRRHSRSRGAGRTAARHRGSTTTSGTSRARTCSSPRSSASRTSTRRGST